MKDTWIQPHLCEHLAANTDWEGREGPNLNTKGPGQAAQLYLPEAAEMQQVVVNTGLQGEGHGGNMPAAEEENDCWEEQRKSFAAMCVKIQGYLEQSRR